MKAKQARGEPILYPPNPAPHLTDWLFDIGPSVSGGMGEGPLTLTQIADDLAVLGIEVLPWEARTLRRLSQAFISQRIASEKQCPAPYNGDRSEIATRRAAIANKVMAAFRPLAQQSPEPTPPAPRRGPRPRNRKA